MIKRYNKNYWLLLLCFMAMAIVSCSDDDNGGGLPVIHSVRITDPALVDSTFTDASRGQMIVIQGENLHGVSELYMNDQPVGFNMNYNTSTHLIATIPADLVLVGENADLKSEIRLITSHGEATFAFHVLAPTPVISRYEVILTETPEGLQVVPGQRLDIYGENFYEVERVYLTNVNPFPAEGEQVPTTKEEYDVQSFTVADKFTHIIVSMPATIIPEGYLVVECYSGKSAYGFASRVPAPVITGLSSDMPIPGSAMTIFGRNLLEVISVDVNGEYEISVSDLVVAPTQDKVTFTLPTAPQQAGKLAIITQGGRAEIDFYPYSNLVIDFDATTSWWWSWGANERTSETGNHAPSVTSGLAYGVDDVVDNQWWFGVWNFGGISYPTVIPDATPVANIEVRFECYVSLDLQGTTFRFNLCDGEAEGYAPADRTTGATPIGQWFTCSIPLSKFTTETTYGAFSAKNNGNFSMATSPTAAGITVATYFDNFRFIIK